MKKRPANLRDFNKKELKDFVNNNGFYCSAEFSAETNAPKAYEGLIPEDATFFKAIASNGELNRNGYIIRESAWKAAIDQYMTNPVVLLQHDQDQPIGKVLSAKVTKEGLVIEGYVFDKLTKKNDSDEKGRFSMGLFNGVSTGHLTEEIEFQNETTGQVLSEEEFRNLPWQEKEADHWVMAVTALDWLENSIVSIGANKKSLVQARDVVKNYVELLKNEVEEETEEKAPETTPEIVEEKQNEQTETEQEGDEIVPAETPAAEVDPAENTEDSEDSETVKVSKEEVEQVNEVIKTLVNAINAKDQQIQTLQSQLDNIPMRKGLSGNGIATVFKKDTPKKSYLGELLQANGIQINS